MLKGVKTRLSATISGREYHRSGMNSKARSKDLLTIDCQKWKVSQGLFKLHGTGGFGGLQGKKKTYDDPLYTGATRS